MIDILVDDDIAKFDMDALEFSWSHEIAFQLTRCGYNAIQERLGPNLFDAHLLETCVRYEEKLGARIIETNDELLYDLIFGDDQGNAKEQERAISPPTCD